MLKIHWICHSPKRQSFQFCYSWGPAYYMWDGGIRWLRQIPVLPLVQQDQKHTSWCDDAVGAFWLYPPPHTICAWVLENIKAKNKNFVMSLHKSPYPLLCHLKTLPPFHGGHSGGPAPMRLLTMVVPPCHGGPRPPHTLCSKETWSGLFMECGLWYVGGRLLSHRQAVKS